MPSLPPGVQVSDVWKPTGGGAAKAGKVPDGPQRPLLPARTSPVKLHHLLLHAAYPLLRLYRQRNLDHPSEMSVSDRHIILEPLVLFICQLSDSKACCRLKASTQLGGGIVSRSHGLTGGRSESQTRPKHAFLLLTAASAIVTVFRICCFFFVLSHNKSFLLREMGGEGQIERAEGERKIGGVQEERVGR